MKTLFGRLWITILAFSLTNGIISADSLRLRPQLEASIFKVHQNEVLLTLNLQAVEDHGTRILVKRSDDGHYFTNLTIMDLPAGENFPLIVIDREDDYRVYYQVFLIRNGKVTFVDEVSFDSSTEKEIPLRRPIIYSAFDPHART